MSKILSFFIFFAVTMAYGQKMNIIGTVRDTSENSALPHAVVMAVKLKDSMLVGFTRTNAQGLFELKDLNIDTVQIIISHPRFSEQTFYVLGSDKNKDFDFGMISLPHKSQQLNEVIIYAFKDPVYYKGDTLVYVADSFKVKPNATVEDLLKKLPGIKVDANGKITSQGKEVSQVLVDGDEFFGTDPTMATRNLAAQGVESVQVYEKKDESSGQTGEETIQVMDLKLKEDAKKGYFGKVSGASDFQKFYEGELLANKFKGSQKISVFALASNTPRSSFGWQDMYKYGLFNFEENEEGYLNFNMEGGVPQGIPQTLKSGIFYNDKLSKNTKLNFNYSYNNNLLDASGSNRSQYFLRDTTYTTDDNSNSHQETSLHSINFKLSQKLDSLTDLEIEPKLRLNYNKTSSFQQTNFLTAEDSLSRRTDITNRNIAQGYNINTNARLIRRFKKKDRFLSLTYNIVQSDDRSTGILKSENYFYDSFTADSIIDQQKLSTSISTAHNALLIYTEPITQKVKLSLDYNFNYSTGHQSKETKNYNNGEYSVYDSTFTNDFENVKSTNRLGLKYIYEVKKISFNVGARLRNVSVVNTDLINGGEVKQSVNNILPFLGLQYKISENSRLNFRYTSNSSQPSLNQLQPVPDNSNPNQIRVGNPNLLPTFSNTLNLRGNIYKPLSGKYFWTNVSLTQTQNAFANSIIYDSLGRSYTSTVNVNGNYNGNFYVSAGIPFFSKVLTLEPNIKGSHSRNSGFINEQRNITESSNLGAGLQIAIQTDSLDFTLEGALDYFDTRSSLNAASNRPYTTQRYTAAVKWQLPWKFMIESSATYTINAQRADGYNINTIIWDASLSKAFLKNENLILTLSGNDLLNQNISTNRSVQDNVITDSKNNIISRYFLLKLTYKFNSTNTKDNDDDDY